MRRSQPSSSSAPGLAQFKEGVTLAALQALTDRQTELAAAQEIQLAKAESFRLFNAARTRMNKSA